MMFIKCNKGIKANNAEVVSKVFKGILRVEDEPDRHKEHFWVMGLNVKNKIEYIELVSLGTLTEGLVHPREVFRSAIIKSVSNLIFCHNHPSGDPEPSKIDIDITEILKKAGDILGIKVLDHIIIGNSFYSFLTEKLI